jgi:oxaloacetate decarboxylase alpha subunit
MPKKKRSTAAKRRGAGSPPKGGATKATARRVSASKSRRRSLPGDAAPKATPALASAPGSKRRGSGTAQPRVSTSGSVVATRGQVSAPGDGAASKTGNGALGPVHLTDVILRDAHQSLLATRMRTEDMLPVAEKLDAVGYHALEVWGGATFDTAMRFLYEDPWVRLRELKKRIKKTPLQMLLRGQNVVGYRHYADDVVEAFCARSVDNGVTIFRIFDALNDVRNLETAFRAVRRAGGHVQGTISYTVSPVHTIDAFAALARDMQSLGAHSLCLKDMAGLLSPVMAAVLVKRLKAETALPVYLHCHSTSGMADMALLKAIEAGADGVDVALSPLAQGTSHPPTESVAATFRETERNPGLDLDLLIELSDYFRNVRKRYWKYESNLIGIDAGVLVHQVPGGMLSNLVSQLREQGAADKLSDVLAENARVRKDLGYPPLVTPTSQIVGSQAVINVLQGERYKTVTREVQNYVQGLYGRSPAPIDADLRKKIIGERHPIDHRPADDLAPELEKAKKEIGDLAESDEDVLSYVMFPQVARTFFEWRRAGAGADPALIAAVAAALAAEPHDHHPAEGHGHGHTHGHGHHHGHGPSAWRLAGRIAQILTRW